MEWITRPALRVFRILCLSSFLSLNSSELESMGDIFHFGRHWPKISTEFTHDTLLQAIEARQQEIHAQKEKYRPLIEREGRSFQEEVAKLLVTGSLKPSSLGNGGLYLLYDAQDRCRFIIKPVDEAINCLNNPKNRGSPYNDRSHRLRRSLPLYHSPPTEAAVSALAKAAGISSSTPETYLMLISSPLFYDISARYSSVKAGPIEKLCSVQRFITDSIDLTEAIHEWRSAGLHKMTPIPIDQEDYEDVILLLWLIFDGDGHSNNFRIYCKTIDKQGVSSYGIRKIDNGLALPEDNSYFLNYLRSLPNAHHLPSQRMIHTIRELDSATYCQILDHYHLEYAKQSLCERLILLRHLIEKNDITIEEINLRYETLCLPNGKEYARATAFDPIQLAEGEYPEDAATSSL